MNTTNTTNTIVGKHEHSKSDHEHHEHTNTIVGKNEYNTNDHEHH